MVTRPSTYAQVRAAEQKQKERNASFVKAVGGSGEQSTAMLQARGITECIT